MAVRDRLARAIDGATGDGTEDADRPLALVLASGAIAALLLSPLVWLGLQTAAVGPDAILVEVTSPTVLDVLATSLALVAAVTAGSVLIGVPLAFLTARTDLPFRRFWTVAVALPLVVPSYIGAFAFVSAFGPRGIAADALAPVVGPVTEALAAVGITLPPVYGFHGAVLVLTLFVYPYVFLTTRASLLSLDDTLLEAARTLGTSRWQAFRRVTLPQILPGITAGALLVALYALSDFGTPAIMRVQVFTNVIYAETTSLSQGGVRTAAVLSLQLLAVTAVILAIESRVGGTDPRAHVGGGGARSDRIALGAWTLPALSFCAAVVLTTLVVPVAVLGLWHLRSGPGYAGGGLAFEPAMAWHSVWLAVAAALAATLLALPVAYLSGRYDGLLATVFDRATYVGYAVPGVVLGMALVYFGLNYASWAYQTVPLLVFAYVVRFVPQSVGSVRSSVLQVDPKLEDAARTLGRSRLGTFRSVTLPLVLPGVAAGAALVFLTTMKELPVTLMLRPFHVETLVTYIWRVQEGGYYGKAALPALALIGISALSMFVILAQERHDSR